MGVMVWIALSENRDRWWSVINAVMNSVTSINTGKFITNVNLCNSQLPMKHSVVWII